MRQSANKQRCKCNSANHITMSIKANKGTNIIGKRRNKVKKRVLWKIVAAWLLFVICDPRSQNDILKTELYNFCSLFKSYNQLQKLIRNKIIVILQVTQMIFDLKRL